jgi:hypothetical protein
MNPFMDDVGHYDLLCYEKMRADGATLKSLLIRAGAPNVAIVSAAGFID